MIFWTFYTAYTVTRLVDIRTIPRSRHNPQFNQESLSERLKEFVKNIDELIGLAKEGQVAIMCAEVLPWRCHRWLIADSLTIRGVQVEHIMTIKKSTKHSLTRWAHVEGTDITYPQSLA